MISLITKNKGLLVYSVIMSLVFVGVITWMNFDTKQKETTGFLHERPWYWIESDLPIATPIPPTKEESKQPLESAWGFSLSIPAGYYEIHIIPRHREICIELPDYKKDCQWIRELTIEENQYAGK